MNTREPYWKKHEAYCAHYPLAEIQHESGKWELYRVTYKPTQNYDGGDFHEIYWQGDLQMDQNCMGEFVTNPKEMLEQFIDFWLDENRG
jgi:hypothetical protein